MNLAQMIQKIKKHPDYPQAGMILCHNGVVRNTSRDGDKVSGLRIKVDREKLSAIVNANKKKPGIIEILVDIEEGRDLFVGDDVMFLVVAGDIRENVIATLEETLNSIKRLATHKTEIYAE